MTNQELIDRYVHAVKFWLPRKQQNDIIAELAEDLHSLVEEREDALGHPLDEAGMVDLLKRRGDPMRVASGYIPQMRIMDPVLVPIYRLVLKIVLLWVLAPLLVIVFIGPLFGPGNPGGVIASFLGAAWQAGFIAVGIITTVFALIDRYHPIKDSDFDPRKLPRVTPAHEANARYQYFASAVFGVAGAVFWAGLMWHRTQFSLPNGPHFVLGPVWQYLYWPVLGFTVTDATVNFLAFLYPVLTQFRLKARLVLDACSILVASALLKVDNWVQLTGPNVTAADLAKAMPWINGTIEVTLICIAIGGLIDAVVQIRRMPRRPQALAVPASRA